MSENQITAFVDSVGRIIVARENTSASTDDKLAVTNPSVVNINVNQESGQITVQLLPYIFREFISTETRYKQHTWDFNKSQITTSSDISLDDSITTQYINIFETEPVPVEAVDEVDVSVEEAAEVPAEEVSDDA